MKIGVIGLDTAGCIIAGHLLAKTAHDICTYDPDGRRCGTIVWCSAAAELFDQCERIVIALTTPAELTALCNAVSSFLHTGQIIIDLTDTSPALAHSIANGMRRFGVSYLDCGVFGSSGLTEPFSVFVGGNGESFSAVQSLIRCFAPGCRYVGPSGRGQAMRIICRALASKLMCSIKDMEALAASFGISRPAFINLLGSFEEIAAPLAELEGKIPPFDRKELLRDAALADEMARRAGLYVDGQLG
ncbi:NAD(P)-binding domain-containing protein [Anaerotruncus colihominis]|uniref:NAD(P)-dependent oxidoreductase n=1 Tax=Anaerotruncus colihominis TaxID=169435 RepID=A0A845RDB1_9FIRM|nr:NAD(P)-binding domain-containing protein [Anaerotruncus colihominis]NBI77673.1 NAD(P)-dependent oxidoreductase [Anaerotruncus colihominis]